MLLLPHLFPLPNFPDPQEQVQQQQERIEELEEALRESVRITAQREIVVAERQAMVEAADEKVIIFIHQKCGVSDFNQLI